MWLSLPQCWWHCTTSTLDCACPVECPRREREKVNGVDPRRDTEGHGEGQGRRFAADEAGLGEEWRESFCPRRGAKFREEEGYVSGGEFEGRIEVLGGGDHSGETGRGQNCNGKTAAVREGAGMGERGNSGAVQAGRAWGPIFLLAFRAYWRYAHERKSHLQIRTGGKHGAVHG